MTCCRWRTRLWCFCHSLNGYQSSNGTGNVPLDIIDQDITQLNTCSKNSGRCRCTRCVICVCRRFMWPCALLSFNLWLIAFCASKVPVQSFPMIVFVYAACTCLFLFCCLIREMLRGLVAPEQRKVWLGRHLLAARMRTCTVYSVVLDEICILPWNS